MIARFDHRPMLTAALALTTTVLLVVVVVTFSTLLITTAPQAPSPTSGTGGGNPAGPAPKGMDPESFGEVYGWNIQAGSSDVSNDSDIDRHAEVVAASHNSE